MQVLSILISSVFVDGRPHFPTAQKKEGVAHRATGFIHKFSPQKRGKDFVWLVKNLDAEKIPLEADPKLSAGQTQIIGGQFLVLAICEDIHHIFFSFCNFCCWC